MKTRHLLLFTLTLLFLLLALAGCGRPDQGLDGKYIATFELNGGTLEYQTSSSRTKVNFAYHPGTYILDPAEIPGYNMYRNGYNFIGWYTSEQCLPSEKWDFSKNTFDTDSLTLYAGWEKAIKYTFTVMYMNGEESVALGEYKVSPGAAFDDWRQFAAKRDGYTPIGYYADPTLTTPWSADTVHPGGESDTDIPVYVDYIVGEWELVDNYAALKRAIENSKNVYLTADIDCGGGEFSFKKDYGGVLEGNGYTVSNFTVTKTGTLFTASCSIFSSLLEGAEIRNLALTNVTYVLFGVTDAQAQRGLRVAALAQKDGGAKVTSVSIQGVLQTDYDGELPTLLSPFYEGDAKDVTGFTADITVEK